MTSPLVSPPLQMRGLYAITPDEADTGKLADMAEAAISGGCRWLQYRQKTMDTSFRQQQAAVLSRLCQQYNVALIINDDFRLAREVDAAGVHLGKSDASPAEARRFLGEAAVIGVSCYQDLTRARRFTEDGQEMGKTNRYLAFGAAYLSSTKPEAPLIPFVPADFFREAAMLPLPVCAIGGITLENALPLIRAGVSMIAVIHDIFSRPVAAIADRVAAYQQLFEEFPHA